MGPGAGGSGGAPGRAQRPRRHRAASGPRDHGARAGPVRPGDGVARRKPGSGARRGCAGNRLRTVPAGRGDARAGRFRATVLYHECLAIYWALGDCSGAGLALLGLADIARGQGDVSAVGICRSLSDQHPFSKWLPHGYSIDCNRIGPHIPEASGKRRTAAECLPSFV